MSQPAEWTPRTPVASTDDPADPTGPAATTVSGSAGDLDATDDPNSTTDPADHTDALTAADAEPKRRRWPVAVGAIVVVALLLSSAAYGGLRAWYGWGNTEPEQVVPAGVVTFERIDLAPGYREKLQLAGLVKKFPAGKASGPAGAVDGVERQLFQGTGLNFARDIKPWFADRAGFAVWLRAGKPVTVLVLASDDDAKARKALGNARIAGRPVGFTLLDGYALVVRDTDGGTAAAQDIAAAARAHPLADDPGYRKAIRRLRVNSVAYSYTDLTRVATAIRAAITADPTLSSATAAGLFDPESLEASLGGLTGSLSAGASVVDGGVEVLLRGTGLPAASSAPVDAREHLGAAPADALAAFASNGSPPDSAGTGLLGSAIATLLLGAVGVFPLGGGDDGDLTLVPVDPGGLPDGDGLGTVGPDGKPIVLDPAQQAELQAILEEFQQQLQERLKKISDGVLAVLSSRVFSLAITGFGPAGPTGQLDVQPRDAAGGKAITDLGAILAAQPGLAVEQAGDTVRVNLGDKDTSVGTLRDSELFRSALGSVPGTPELAGYLDVTRLLAASGAPAALRERWAPVHAIGLVAARNGTELTAIVRVVIP